MEDFFNKNRLTSGLESEIKNMLCKNSQKITVKKGDLIIRNCSKDKNKIFIVKSGSICQKMPVKKAENFNEGDLFGEIPILTGAEKHNGNFIAEKDSELIKINKLALETLLSNPKTQNKVQNEVMRKIAKNKSLFNK